MKTIIAGSRSFNNMNSLLTALEHCPFSEQMTEVVSGHARGVDRLGEQYAARAGIPVRIFPADWETLGKAAGFIRNVQMADYADALVAIWDGESRGTKHMIETAKSKRLRIFVSRQ